LAAGRGAGRSQRALDGRRLPRRRGRRLGPAGGRREGRRGLNCARSANPLKPCRFFGGNAMTDKNPLLERLAAGGAFGSLWLALGSVAAAEIMAEARPDSMIFDL